jgi:hypothetical protein
VTHASYIPLNAQNPCPNLQKAMKLGASAILFWLPIIITLLQVNFE